MDEILKLVKLEKSFVKASRETKILDSLSLSVMQQSINCIVGESGCGKTTMCKIITGLERADSGEIIFQGNKMDILKRRTPDDCFDIQYIFQDPYSSINGEATVKAVLEEPLKLCRRYGRKARTISEVLKLTGINENIYLNSRTRILSGGQRQRLSIARALMVNPKLIIADECTSMLDDDASNEICNLFLTIRDTYDISLLVVTHNINVIKTLSDNVLIMNGGHIVEQGSLESIISSPQDKYTSLWSKSMIRIEGELFHE